MWTWAWPELCTSTPTLAWMGVAAASRYNTRIGLHEGHGKNTCNLSNTNTGGHHDIIECYAWGFFRHSRAMQGGAASARSTVRQKQSRVPSAARATCRARCKVGCTRTPFKQSKAQSKSPSVALLCACWRDAERRAETNLDDIDATQTDARRQPAAAPHTAAALRASILCDRSSPQTAC